jgi:lipoyl(octanoyl) transferase
MNIVRYIDLGLKDYKETWDYQQDIQNRLIQAKLSGINPPEKSCLIFVEHPHVFTLGKSGKENNLLINRQFLDSIGATFYKIDRGGDITYHGPGQLVGYPVFDLDQQDIGVKKFIALLEESIILALKETGIKAGRMNGATGVWIQGPNQTMNKICAIGVKISRGVTMHGFALNVNTDLQYFSYINPCGFTDKGVTSVEKETGKKAAMKQIKKTVLAKITQLFNLSPETGQAL